MEFFSRQQLAIIQAIQDLGNWLEPMTIVSALGSEEFYLLLIPLLYWCIDKSLGVNLGLLLVLSNWVNNSAKGLFKAPRPFWLRADLALSAESSFGFPSGHAQTAVSLWGFLALRCGGLLHWLPILLIALISLSRLYLGVHFLGDVLGGWLLGVIVLLLYARLKPRAAIWLEARAPTAHVVLALAAGLLVLAVHALAQAIPLGHPETYGALVEAASADAMRVGAGLAGMVTGLWIGLALEARYVRFAVGGTFWQRLGRYLAGLAGLLLIWLGLKLVFPPEPYALGLALRAVRYMLLMVWVLLVWPWVYVRLGLAARASAVSLPNHLQRH